MVLTTEGIEDIKALSDNEFIKKHERLVHFIARRYRKSLDIIKENTNLEYADLSQIGSIGLLKARDYFDPNLGWKFSTYAARLIWGEIQIALRDCSKIKVPRKMYESRNKILKEEIYNEDDEVIARMLDVPVSLVKEIKSYTPTYTSFDQAVGTPDGNKETFLSDLVADAKSAQYYDELDESDVIRRFLETLSDRERIVWDLHSNLELKQAAIGKELGFSQAQISRVLKSIDGKAIKFGKKYKLNQK